jgi:hypothetical protein
MDSIADDLKQQLNSELSIEPTIDSFIDLVRYACELVQKKGTSMTGPQKKELVIRIVNLTFEGLEFRYDLSEYSHYDELRYFIQCGVSLLIDTVVSCHKSKMFLKKKKHALCC